MTAISIFRIANGKAVEQWIINDGLGLLQQLGVAPRQGKPGSDLSVDINIVPAALESHP